jgi:hypothetical protein
MEVRSHRVPLSALKAAVCAAAARQPNLPLAWSASSGLIDARAAMATRIAR